MARLNKVNVASVVLVCSVVACSAHPENKLLGKWQSQSARYDLPVPMSVAYTQVRLEFLRDGTVIQSGRDERSRVSRSWDQNNGTFHLIDPTHLKVDLGWLGSTVYELNWRDDDHMTLRVDDSKMELERVK